MKTIKFINQPPLERPITGGQAYDQMLLSILKDTPGLHTEYVAMETSSRRPSMLTSPLRYIFKGWKHRKSDAIVFNSASYMWFLPLMCIYSLLGVKTMTTHHLFMYRDMKGLKRIIYKACEWTFLRLASRIIIPSPYIYDETKKKIAENKLLKWWIPFESMPLYPSKPSEGTLSFMGTIEHRKGLHLLLESLSILKESGKLLKLTVIGKPTEQHYNQQILNYIKDHNLNVEFTGFLSREDREKILSTTDVFVFPSLHEGFGMVLVEAQVYGLPIVSFNNSAMPYTVKNGVNGYAVKTGDTKAFADAINKILEDRNLRKHLSNGAIENAHNQMTHKRYEKTVRDYFLK